MYDNWKLQASPEGTPIETEEPTFNYDAAVSWWDSFDEDRYSDICKLKFS